MVNFEDRLRESAKRNMERQHPKMKVPENPLHGRCTYWGWVATPVAAVFGVFLGLTLPLMVDKAEPTLALAVDTLRGNSRWNDTVYLTKIEKQEVVRRDTVYLTKWRDRQPERTVHESLEPECTSIACDGIDYALLVSN